jgi:hypothetical protein
VKWVLAICLLVVLCQRTLTTRATTPETAYGRGGLLLQR